MRYKIDTSTADNNNNDNNMLLYVSSEYVCMSTRSIDRLYGALLTRRIEFVWRTSCNDSWNGKRISYTQLNAQLWQGRLSSGHLSKQTIFVCIYMMRTFSLFLFKDIFTNSPIRISTLARKMPSNLNQYHQNLQYIICEESFTVFFLLMTESHVGLQ